MALLQFDWEYTLHDKNPGGLSLTAFEQHFSPEKLVAALVKDRFPHSGFHELDSLKSSWKDIRKTAERFRQHCDHIFFIGIGGSSLGPKFLYEALSTKDSPSITFCDHLDTDVWQEWADTLDWQRTLIVVVSKSGRTTETLSAFLYFQNHIQQKGLKDKDHVLIITDPQEGPLCELANEKKWASLSIPPSIGGRYSIMTSVGLFPLAFMGFNGEEFLSGAEDMKASCLLPDIKKNPALMGAWVAKELYLSQSRSMRILFTYGERLSYFGDWYAQLWAESLGKITADFYRKGITPIVARGPQDQHSQLQLYLEGPADKYVSFFSTEPVQPVVVPPSIFSGDTWEMLTQKPMNTLQAISRKATQAALNDQAVPSHHIGLRMGLKEIGGLLFWAMMETVYTSLFLEVNPFDQPGVEGIKKHVRTFLS